MKNFEETEPSRAGQAMVISQNPLFTETQYAKETVLSIYFCLYISIYF